jgi:hypothetical protein
MWRRTAVQRLEASGTNQLQTLQRLEASGTNQLQALRGLETSDADQLNRDELYRKARLTFARIQTQLDDLQNKLSATQTIAEQFFVADIAIIGIMAAAALGIEQIYLQLPQAHGHVPPTDPVLTRAGLIGILIFSCFTAVSAIFAAASFLRQTIETGPTPEDLAQQGANLSAAEQVILAGIKLQEGLLPARSRVATAGGRLGIAIGALVLGVVAGVTAALLIRY